MKRLLWILVPCMALCLMGVADVGPKHSVQTYRSIEAFGKQLAKEHQLQFLNSGLGGLADAKQGLWAVNLVSREQMTLEQGRQLATTLAQQLLNKLYSDPVFARYCQKEKADRQLKKEYVAFRLAFWNKEVDRPLHPYLAQIRLADGQLYYHYADPKTQALQEPIVEAFDIPLEQLSRAQGTGH